MRTTRWMIPVMAVTLLGACASRPPVAGSAPVYGASQSAYAVYGQVARIDAVQARQNTSGAGALIGGATGAVVGRQFGNSSNGRAMGTFLGAIAGVFIGNEIEKDQSGQPDVVRISVALDNGGYRHFDYRDAGGLRVGDRVRIEGDRLYRF